MIKKRLIYWIAGTLTAFAGVFAVRVLAQDAFAQWRLAVQLSGYTLSALGLFIITIGTRRKE